VSTIVSLSECCEFIKDGTHGSPLRTREGIPVLSAAHVRDGRLHFDTDRFTTQEELGTFQKRLKPSCGDVLLTIVGTICRTAIISRDRPLVFQRSVCVLRPNKSVITSPYLKSALESEAVKSQFHVEKHEVAQAGIYLEALNEIKIPLPSLPEQERITQLLDGAERLRRTRRYALELTDIFLPATFLELFDDPVKNPRGFDHVQLEDDLECIESGFSPVCDGPRKSVNQWAVLGLGAVTTGIFKPAENKRLPDDVPPRPELEVHDGDVLVTRKNTYDLVAACALVRSPPQRLLLPDTIFRFRLKGGSRLSPVFLWGLFSFPSFRKRVQGLASGSAGSMPGISKSKFMSINCPAPPFPLQQKFAALVERVECLRAVQREALRQAEHLFQTLLHRAFSENRLTDS
jgi:type I restriction enzyme S subunit